MAQAVGVFYNHSGSLPCYDFKAGVNPETDEDGHFWDYQWCTEMFMPFSKDGGETSADDCIAESNLRQEQQQHYSNSPEGEHAHGPRRKQKLAIPAKRNASTNFGKHFVM